ncbi:MAG TPA: ankyrin repeat domain-containing protein [Candidatus Rifleibacterium sp.]|nr:ankyrin repeat domain-containing protein [Candidatus Rifleibacterium sp.]
MLTLERFPDYLNHSWSAGDKGKPFLKFNSLSRKEAGEFFFNQLRELAEDSKLFVTESCSIISDGMPSTRINLVINRSELTDVVMHETIEHFKRHEALSVSTVPLRFPFETVERHIIALDHEMIELLNGRDSLFPLCDLDRQLLEAAEHLDMKRMSDMVRAGANINCIDDNGETPLTCFISAAIFEHKDFAERDLINTTDLARSSESFHSKCEEECLINCRELLKMGADPNLFGFDGYGALQEAVYQSFPRIVELLLQHGANPNYSPFAEESPWIISQPLESASTERSVCESDEEKKRCEKIILLLKRHGARISSNDDGEIYPSLPPYQPDEDETTLGEKAADARVFYLACQMAAGINRHEPGIFAPFLTDDVLYENTASGIQKKGLLTVLRHFDETIDVIQANFMKNHVLIEIAICKTTHEPVLIMHGTRKQFPVGIGGPVGQLRIETDSEGMIQKILSENPPSDDQIISEYLFPGFASAEFQELQRNMTGRIPPTHDVQINVNVSMGITLQEIRNAARCLKDEYPCIRIQEIHSEEVEKISFYKVCSMPSLDIFYKGRLMRRFGWSCAGTEIIEGGRQLFEPGFFPYVGQEGHGDR